MVYLVFKALRRCCALSSELYLMEKSSTTSEKRVSFVSCFQSPGVVDCVVSVWCQVLDELLVCDDSGLLDSIHTLEDLNVETFLVVYDGKKAVLINDLFGDERYMYLHILRVA